MLGGDESVLGREMHRAVSGVGTRVRWKSVVAAINEEHNVEGLCWELPERVEALRLEKGGRSPK